MRIGMMLRSWSESGWIGVYTRNLVQELLRIDDRNHYVLFYRSAADLGNLSDRANVTECVVRAPNKAAWDQLAIPVACRREKVDVVFHPKFTVPLFAPCKAIMVVHGADWFIADQAQYYDRFDLLYIRTMMPLYFRKAAAVISVSQLTTDAFRRVMSVPPEKIQTVYFGPARHFRRITDSATLERARARYRLPEQFILTLTKRGGGERKNLGRTFRAYARYHEQEERPYKLVVGGKDCHLYRAEYGIPDDGYGRDIAFPGWIDQEDLPAVYSLARLYLYPSNVEAFPIPLTEAMACGTPIVTSNVNGLDEIAGNAALLVDPRDVDAIADAVRRVASDPELHAKLSAKGLARSALFTWDACATKTLHILESLGG